LIKTIYINGRFLSQPITGVQRYAREIVIHFDRLLEDNTLKHKISIQCLVPPGTIQDIVWKNIATESIGVNRGNVWEQVDLPLYLKGKFLFSPANCGPFLYQNQAVTFHDASVFAVPHAYSFLFKTKYKLIFPSLSRLAKIIFTNSKFSQAELARYLRQPPGKFKVIHLAGDHIERIQPDQVILQKYNLYKNKYFLVAGSQSLHKNLATVQLATKLMDNNIKVVFAGRQYESVFNTKTVRPISDNTVILGSVSDEELKSLYLNALGLIFPSYYEGFGLPILEAMHCGCPVLCSCTASLPEIAGEAALFFDPTNPNEIAEVMDSVYSDEYLRNDLIQKGFKRAREFAWETTAYHTLNTLLTM